MYSDCKRQLQTIDQGFRVISALINAASPEKMDRNAKLRGLECQQI